MSSAERFFSADFVTAQRRFRDAIARGHGRLDSLPLAARGPLGEPLAIDIGWFGAAHPKRVLVHSSGIHGVEGYAGSAIQLQWLAEGIPVLPSDAAIAVVHVLNPYGFAWRRRVNENNVDLNRNFFAHDGIDAPGERGAAAIDAFLNPRVPPRRDVFYARAAALALRHGLPYTRQAVTAGQNRNPRGLFYAGTALEPGAGAYENYVRENLAQAQWIVGIDVHTGLGPYAGDTLLVDAAAKRGQVNQTMRETFGARLRLQENEGFAYRVRGAQHDMYYRRFPHAAVHFAGQEFGTFHGLRVLAALRAENYWHHQGADPDHPARKALLETFCPADDRWRIRVLERGRAVMAQACTLAFSPAIEPSSGVRLAESGNH